MVAIYAGETVRIYSEALDWDNSNVLSPSTVTAVQLTITASDRVVVDSVPMVWVQEETRWLYEWSAPKRPGVYRLEVTYQTDSGVSKEVKTLRLSS